MKRILKTNNLIAIGVFLTSLVVYLLSFQRTVPYWDCGEFVAAGATMGVPHPPGAPLFTLVGRIFIMFFPFGDNPGFKMNIISVFSSALTIMFLYLIIVQALTIIKKGLNNRFDTIVTYSSGIIGALAYSFSDSFWFSAVESEVYAASLFFLSIIVWLAMVWYTTPDKASNDHYILIMAYLMGLSIGVHQLSLLCFFLAAWLVYFKLTEEITAKNLLIFMAGAPFLFFIIYPGIVEWLPSMLDGSITKPIEVTDSGLLQIFPGIITLAIIYGIYHTHKKHHRIINIALISMLLIMIGYTTYILVPVRAHQNPPLNMGAASTTQNFVDYMERKQYGEQPSVLKRRTSQQPEHQKNYKKYISDWDFFWRYQLGHMYFRYFGWNFIGRAGDIQNAPVVLFKDIEGWTRIKGWPQKYYAIPFIIGLLGLFYHFRKDFKVSVAFLSLFLVSGVGLIVFFNVPEPQPRERDYFVVGSFFVFAFWIGLGANAIIDFLKKLSKKNVASYAGILILAAAIPVNMLIQNFHTHDRSLNLAPFDSGYNILQSCKKDAILFTAGDNDTYPLWYLQNAEGIRRDIRIVNLSLVNVDWYCLQAKHDEPFGAKKVPISLSDEEIKMLGERYYSELPAQPAKLPPVPRERWAEYGIADSSQILDLTFQIPPTTQIQGRKVMRMQDFIIYDILMTTKWERPVYFALTSGPGERIGLDPFLDVQGMAMEITPIKRPGNRYNLNEKVFEEQLLQDDVKPSKDFQRGFLFRNYNNPNINIEEQGQDILDTYRALYSMVAREIAMKDKEKAKKYIDAMEKKMPHTVIPMPNNLVLDFLELVMYLNHEEKIAYYSKFAEADAMKAIAANPKDMQSLGILTMIYEKRKEYQKALDIYNKYLQDNPGDQTVKNRITYVRSLMASDSQSIKKSDTTKK